MAETADHERMMRLVEQLSPATRARIGQRLDDRFHEITGTPRERTTMPDPREIAEHAIRDAAEAINGADVERATSVPRRRFGLTGDQAAALRAEVDELIRSAVITVTFPGSPGRKTTIGEPESETDHG